MRRRFAILGGARARSGEGGAIGIVSAMLLTILFAVAALAVDVGALYYERRSLQAATDAAALAAAWRIGDNPDNLGAVTAAANAAITGNGYDTSEITEVVTGAYAADAALAPAQRFVPNGAPRNAVRVTTSVNSPLYFARTFVTRDTTPVVAQAVATRVDEAAFSAGTGLAHVDTTSSPLLNALLGGLLGTSLNLTAVQYNGLIDAKVNALEFLDALAVELNLTAGTYEDLLATDVGVGQLLDAMIDVLRDNQVLGVSLEALQALRAQVAAAGSTTLKLADLLDLGLLRGLPLGEGRTAVDATLNVFDLIMASAQVANGTNVVTINNLVNLLGLATVDLRLSVVERPRYAIGPVGTQVHTAQTRLALDVKLLKGVPVLSTLAWLHIPIYIEAAPGDATLTAIDCGLNPRTDTTVTIQGQTRVAGIYITDLPASWMTNFSQPVPNPMPGLELVRVVDLGLLGLATIKTRSSSPVTAGTNQVVSQTFAVADANADPRTWTPNPWTVSSGGLTTTLTQSVSDVLRTAEVCLIGNLLCLGDLLGLASLVVNALQPVVNVLDTALLDPLLKALGIKLGYMDVQVHGARCGVPKLVM